MQSAVECTASESMLELPVKTAATYLLAATSRLAASAVQITFPVASAMDLGQSPPREVRGRCRVLHWPPSASTGDLVKVRAAVLHAMGAQRPYAQSRPLAIEEL